MESMKDTAFTAVVLINTAAAHFFSNIFQVLGILSVKSDICIYGHIFDQCVWSVVQVYLVCCSIIDHLNIQLLTEWKLNTSLRGWKQNKSSAEQMFEVFLHIWNVCNYTAIFCFLVDFPICLYKLTFEWIIITPLLRDRFFVTLNVHLRLPFIHMSVWVFDFILIVNVLVLILEWSVE